MLERALTQDDSSRCNRLCAGTAIRCFDTVLFHESNHTNHFERTVAAQNSFAGWASPKGTRPANAIAAKSSTQITLVAYYYCRVTVFVKRNLGAERHFFVGLISTLQKKVFYRTEARRYVELPA